MPDSSGTPFTSLTATTIKLELPLDRISSLNISSYGDSSSYASASFKLDNNQYMSITVDWSGNVVPDFVMDLMSLVKKEQASVEACIASNSEGLNNFKEELAMVKKGGKKKC